MFTPLHNALGLDGLTSVYLGSYLHKPRHRMVEETLVALAEITLSAKAFSIKRSPVLHTAGTAEGKVSAEQAFITEILLCAG